MVVAVAHRNLGFFNCHSKGSGSKTSSMNMTNQESEVKSNQKEWQQKKQPGSRSPSLVFVAQPQPYHTVFNKDNILLPTEKMAAVYLNNFHSSLTKVLKLLKRFFLRAHEDRFKPQLLQSRINYANERTIYAHTMEASHCRVYTGEINQQSTMTLLFRACSREGKRFVRILPEFPPTCLSNENLC